MEPREHPSGRGRAVGGSTGRRGPVQGGMCLIGAAGRGEHEGKHRGALNILLPKFTGKIFFPLMEKKSDILYGIP